MRIDGNRVGYSEVAIISVGMTFHRQDRSKELKVPVGAKDGDGGTSDVVV
ncbi:hypothetical protein MA16_Dca029220 [Dendrobium catenatum]|uniref:Uncharacterized protein n=1 Tax=Dendrobium catenatum TaxID=906689 RepID=A0A2I0V704_9ASPA|nr:hypothetical protein MA16_Dca029220 [Dendrobium catenatum]